MAGRHPEDVEATSEDGAIEAVETSDEADDSERAETVDTDDAASDDAASDDAGDAGSDETNQGDGGDRSDRVVEYWAALGIAPVEVSFPRGGTGLTLRQYRIAPEAEPAKDVESSDQVDAQDDDPYAGPDDVDFDDDEEEEEDQVEAPAAKAGVAPGEEEAFFLATDGILHLFRTPASLVEFVQSNTDNDLAGSDNWDELVTTLTPELVVPDDEDRYELDLVVENLRGGHDVWEPDLIVGAGEFARDIAYALDLSEVRAVLASGSPLDDLDEALRAKGFFARRKRKKVGAEQASLGWRSIIGRISSSVEWHD